MSDGVPPPSIRDHPFLAGLDPTLLGAIEDAARLAEYPTGAMLAHEGTPATEFFLIHSGKVALELGGPDRPHLTLQTVGPGEILGWSWLLVPSTWRFDARALKATVAWEVDGARVRDALAEVPSEGYRFLERLLPVLASRLEHARLQLVDLYAP